MDDSNEQFVDVDENGAIGDFEPTFIDVEGIQTRYYDVGSGEPLVLLHDGRWRGSSSANTWVPVFEELGDRFRVLAFDRIGCGMTDNPDSVEEYRFGTELDHALGFLESVGIEGCHLCGSSRGAGLAARMAVEMPERLRTLFLTNSHTFGPAAGDRDHRADRLFKRADPTFDSADPEFDRFLYEQVSYRTDHVTDEFCRTNAYLRSRSKARRTAEVMTERGARFEETVENHVAETHQRIKNGDLAVPTLYVFGRNDTSIPLQTAIGAFELFGRTNSRARLEILNHCGHLPFRERPSEFSSIVAGFVERWQ